MRRIAVAAAMLSLTSCHSSTPQTSALAVGGATIIDNGGDKLTCLPDDALRDGPLPYFEGDYFLDYVLTFDRVVRASDDPTATDWPGLRRRVETILRDKMPAAAASFSRYADLVGNTDPAQERTWRAVREDLTDLKDEQLTETLPDNCEHRDGTGRMVPNIQQLVRRTETRSETASRVEYAYDFDELERLRTESPLQYSYLLVHEWLWDFTQAPYILRSVNRLLHQKSAETMPAEAFRERLAANGIEIDQGPQGPAEGRMRQVFLDKALCDYSDRFAVEVHKYDPINRAVVAPGEARVFPVSLPSDDDLPADGWKACGFAFMMSYKGAGAAAPFTMHLKRGLASYTTSLVAAPGHPQQDVFSGLCKDRLCVNREGALQDLVTPRGFGGSNWKLEVKNTSTSGSVEIVAPYFVFVKMRDQ
jgi:hypothetical protein